MVQKGMAASFAALNEQRREQAIARFAVLRPHLDEGIPLTRAATGSGVPIRTAERWLARYRQGGLIGLARPARRDAGARRVHPELTGLVGGMALKRPRSSAAAIHRRIGTVAKAQGWRVPSYGTVHAIVAALDPGMVTLAQDGPAAFRDRFELVHRHRAAGPNALWQGDHTMLDLLILDETGKPARPWLTTVVDDYSRAIAGYGVFLGAPCVLNTCLALRHAIWRKADPTWPVCGIPDVLYIDHGSDFTSQHLDQVAASLRLRIVYSAIGRPQGRGKVERLFGTFNTELLPELPGHLAGSKPATPPRLSLAELDQAISAFIAGTYRRGLFCEGVAVKFGFIAKHRGIWPMRWLCEALGVSRSGFHAWLTRSPGARARSGDAFGAQVKASFVGSDRTYGARRVWHDVLAEGAACGLHRVERLMREQALRARPRRRGLPSDKGTRHEAADNVLDRQFEATAPNRKWIADFT